MCDLTEDIPAITAHWRKEGIAFDAIYTGYLGSTEQIACVQDIFDTLRKPEALRIADPAMADNGRLYPAFDRIYVEAMKGLTFGTDFILPNITEACFLTGMEYRESYDGLYINELLDRLSETGAKTILLTGGGYAPDTTGVLVRSCDMTRCYEHRKIAKGYHGTGDVYASAFVGAMANGFGAYESAVLAAGYTVMCIELTQGDPEY